MSVPKKKASKDKLSTQDLEQELLISKKTQFNQEFDYDEIMRQTIQEYNNYTKKLHDRSKK